MPWVARAQLGDRAALEHLLLALLPSLRAHVRSTTGDDDLAQDVVQDVLLLVVRKLGQVTAPEAIRAWALRIATREAVRALRRWGRRVESLDDLPELPTEAAPEGVEPELLAALPAHLAGISPAAQAVLRLHYLEGYSQPEVAAILEIPVGTVKSRISYGLAALRRAFANQGGARPR